MSKDNDNKGPQRQRYTDQYILEIYKACKYNKTLTAKRLKVPRKTLSNWIFEIQGEKRYIPEKLKDAKPPSTFVFKRKKRQTLIITCAQNNTPIYEEFYNSLFNLIERVDAQLIVSPVKYFNPNSFVSVSKMEFWWPEELIPYYLVNENDLIVNDNLMIISRGSIGATDRNPIDLAPIAGTRSAVIGHAQLQMKMFPVPQDEYPRMMITTGSISKKNYGTGKAGIMGEFHHTTGALIIEVDGDQFYARQINADATGSFYELDPLTGTLAYYTPDGVIPYQQAEALVCGDIHTRFLDEGVLNATWLDKNSIINTYKPKQVFLHDLLDMFSESHHDNHDPFLQFAKDVTGLNDVHEEVMEVAQFLTDRIRENPDIVYHVIESNHNSHLYKWLLDAPKSIKNRPFYHELCYMMFTKIGENAKQYTKPDGSFDRTQIQKLIPNPLTLYLSMKLEFADHQLKFHGRNQKVAVCEIDLSQHGDVGPNGSIGSAKAFARSGYKSVIGHSHTPTIEKGCYQVGTSSQKNMNYNRGYSSWLHAHCLVYPNGKRSLIFIIEGKWRI